MQDARLDEDLEVWEQEEHEEDVMIIVQTLDQKTLKNEQLLEPEPDDDEMSYDMQDDMTVKAIQEKSWICTCSCRQCFGSILEIPEGRTRCVCRHCPWSDQCSFLAMKDEQLCARCTGELQRGGDRPPTHIPTGAYGSWWSPDRSRQLGASEVRAARGQTGKKSDETHPPPSDRGVRQSLGSYELEENWNLAEMLAECVQDSKPTATPATLDSAQQEQDMSMSIGTDDSQLRSAVDPLMYVATDQPEIQQAVAAAAQDMKLSTMFDQWRLKRAVCYLTEQRPAVAVHVVPEVLEVPEKLETSVDSDRAGDIRSRRNTSGELIRLAGAWIKSVIRSTLIEIGHDVTMALCGDSSPVRWSAENFGLLFVRHLTLKTRFLKEVVQAGLAEICWAKGIANPAGMWTNLAPVSTLNRRLDIADCKRQRRREHETEIIIESVCKCESAVAPASVVARESASGSVRGGGAASSVTRVSSVTRGCLVPTRSKRIPRAAVRATGVGA